MLDSVVLLVEDEAWPAFDHLARGLQRSGVETVRISIGTNRRQTRRVAGSERHVSDSPDALEKLSDVLAGRFVLDAQVTESLAIQVYSILDQLPIAERSTAWEGRGMAVDKINLVRFDFPPGFDTPPVFPVGAVESSDIVRQLSLPLVLKRRIGAGGNEMKIVHSERDLDHLLDGIDDRGAWLVQRFVVGRSMCCAGVVTQHGAESVVIYEIIDRKSPFGSSTRIKFVEDDHLERAAGGLLSSLGIRGFVNVDFIQDSEGKNWVHDINPRVFGMYLECQVAGYNLLDSYTRLLRQGFSEIASEEPRIQRSQRSIGREPARRAQQRRLLWRLVAYWEALGPLYCIDAVTRTGVKRLSRAFRGCFGPPWRTADRALQHTRPTG